MGSPVTYSLSGVVEVFCSPNDGFVDLLVPMHIGSSRSGDSKADDGTAKGFDTILDNPNFVGGPFSYYVRQGFGLAGTAVGQWADLGEACSRIGGFRSVTPLGAPGVSRQQWGEAVSRARAWIPDLSALDF